MSCRQGTPAVRSDVCTDVFFISAPSLKKFFAGEPATGYGALLLSYARHLLTATATGFEPATSRLTVEVTHVFTTGKRIFFETHHVASRLNKYGEANLRAEPSATSARETAVESCRPAVWSGATIKKQPTLETRSQTGNNRPGCSGPSF